MNQLNKQIEYWEKSANIDQKTALGLFQIKRYDGCLFYCHLSLEKLLKGLVVKKMNKTAPYIHRLDQLAMLARLELTEKQLNHLKTISGFNISGRYDEYKFTFYKKCSKKYTEKYLTITNELFLWLRKKYQKK